jgi:hypothetical protein
LQGAEVLFTTAMDGIHKKKAIWRKPAWRLDECDERSPLQMAFMLQQQTVLV